jgi:predicted DCC family thiol-disulfide oxidoreductase YuxK
MSLHDAEVAPRWPDLSREQLMQQLYVVDQQGKYYAGAAALRHLTGRLPALWLLSPLMHIPGSLPLWQRLYAWVARRRYRLSGSSGCDSNESCQFHRGL